MEITKVAIYTRVSTEDQSVDMQVSDLRKFAEQKGYTNCKEYSDIGYSGAKDKRPELERLMKDIQNRKIDIILVWRFDRFSRSVRHLVNTLHNLNQLGVKFISYKENLDTTTSIGRLQFTIISAISEFERDLIRERVIAGIQRAKEKGVKFGRPSLFNVNEFILRVRELKKGGLSMRKIAKKLKVSAALIHKIIHLGNDFRL